MRVSSTWILAVTLLIPSFAGAQSPAAPAAAPADPAAVRLAAQNAVEDLTLKKVIAGLQLTESQLGALLPALQDAQTRLQKLDRENADAIARHKPALEQVRSGLLADKPLSQRAEQQYSDALKLADSRQAGLRAELVAFIKRALTQQLGPQQEALLLQTARSLATEERVAGYQAEAMTGARGGGPITWMGQMMDRIRAMSPEQFRAQQRQMMRGTARGGDPQAAQQRAAFMAQLRSMSPELYQAQRDALAVQMAGQNGGRFGNAPPQDEQSQVDLFIERYFLSPRIVPVIQQRLGGAPVAAPRDRE